MQTASDVLDIENVAVARLVEEQAVNQPDAVIAECKKSLEEGDRAKVVRFLAQWALSTTATRTEQTRLSQVILGLTRQMNGGSSRPAPT